MGQVKIIRGGRVVTKDRIIEGGSVIMEDGVITEIRQRELYVRGVEIHDAEGMWVLPGLIDTHSDAIEQEMQPRPGTLFPLERSFYELEKKLAAQGITTIYHSLCMMGDEGENQVRRNEAVLHSVDTIRGLRIQKSRLHHKIHVRFEITNLNAAPLIADLIRKRKIELLSFMDHTPGQGQYRNIEMHKKMMMERQHLTAEMAESIIQDRIQQPKIDLDRLNALAEAAFKAGIPLASHDDDTLEKLDIVMNWHTVISEFPVTLEVARQAKKKGLHVVMGAPNVMLGYSHSNNVSAREAIREGLVDILCSDYYPPSMLQAVFFLHDQGMDLPSAVNMVSLNPALALGLDRHTGSIEVGKAADLLIVSREQNTPTVEKTFVHGHLVCQLDYLQNAPDAAVTNPSSSL